MFEMLHKQRWIELSCGPLIGAPSQFFLRALDASVTQWAYFTETKSIIADE